MVFEQVPHRDEDDNGVSACWGRGRVDARGDVDVKGGLGGDQLLFENVVKGLAVVVCEENVVSCELGNFAVERPVEIDGRAAGGTFRKGFCRRGSREEVVVGVDKVGVYDDDVRGDRFTGR